MKKNRTDRIRTLVIFFHRRGVAAIDTIPTTFLQENGGQWDEFRIKSIRFYMDVGNQPVVEGAETREVNGRRFVMTVWTADKHHGYVYRCVGGDHVVIQADRGQVCEVFYLTEKGLEAPRHPAVREILLQRAVHSLGLRLPESQSSLEPTDVQIADRIAATIAPQPAPKVARKQRRGEGKPPRGQQSRPRPEYVSDPSFGGGPMQEAFMKLLHGAGTADRLH